jgi:hypothetical protein
MVNEICFFAGGLLVAAGGGFGYIKYKLLQQSNQHDRLYDNLHAKFVFAEEEKVKAKYDKNQLTVDYQKLKQEFQQLADEHNELKEKYKPLAALNPFERQAVGAVTNQSILDEWMNGEIKEGN